MREKLQLCSKGIYLSMENCSQSLTIMMTNRLFRLKERALPLNKLGPVVRRVDNFIQRINPYPADKFCSLSNRNAKTQPYTPVYKHISFYTLSKQKIFIGCKSKRIHFKLSIRRSGKFYYRLGEHLQPSTNSKVDFVKKSVRTQSELG